jgi:O-6-methylguanine DNA methyltransferase
MRSIAFDVLNGTPVGDLMVAVSENGVLALRFGGGEEAFCLNLKDRYGVEARRDPARVAGVLEQLSEYFEGSRDEFELEYDLDKLTPFQQEVLEALQDVPQGDWVTYRELAERIGRARASRAVGQALGRNPIPILIPCHRVIASDGSLGGYSGVGGVETKRKLLEFEGADL